MQRLESSNRYFSPDFQMGTAISAHQAEGNSSGERHADWPDFDGNEPGWWQKGKAEEDLESLASIGTKVQRTSIAWERVYPEKGKIDRKAIRRYREIFDTCHSLGIAPMVTLYHFVLPRWVAQEGGWEKPSIKQSFVDFTQAVMDNFGDISYWVTENETNNNTIASYVAGEWPPYKKNSLKGAYLARRHMIEAHDLCYSTIKRAIPDASVGIANAVIWVKPYSQSLPDRALAGLGRYIYNTNFIEATRDMVDFIGINYYTGYFLKFNPRSLGLATGENEKGVHGVTQIPFGNVIMPDAPVSDMGWPIVPEFFLEVLQFMYKKFEKPIVITENGIADQHDQFRAYYILTHLMAVHEAQRRGVPIPIYLYWASVDNYEWNDGLRGFGLIKVDPITGEHTLRESALLFADIARNHRIDTERLAEEYLPPDQQEMVSKVEEVLTRSEIRG